MAVCFLQKYMIRWFEQLTHKIVYKINGACKYILVPERSSPAG